MRLHSPNYGQVWVTAGAARGARSAAPTRVPGGMQAWPYQTNPANRDVADKSRKGPIVSPKMKPERIKKHPTLWTGFVGFQEVLQTSLLMFSRGTKHVTSDSPDYAKPRV